MTRYWVATPVKETSVTVARTSLPADSGRRGCSRTFSGRTPKSTCPSVTAARERGTRTVVPAASATRWSPSLPVTVAGTRLDCPTKPATKAVPGRS